VIQDLLVGGMLMSLIYKHATAKGGSNTKPTCYPG